MIRAHIYDVVSGEILRTFEGPSDQLSLQLKAGESYLIASQGADNTHYIDTVTATIKVKGDYLLDALPMPCVLTIEGQEYPCTDQPTLNLSPAGTYEISVDAGPKYLKKTFTYEQL